MLAVESHLAVTSSSRIGQNLRSLRLGCSEVRPPAGCSEVVAEVERATRELVKMAAAPLEGRALAGTASHRLSCLSSLIPSEVSGPNSPAERRERLSELHRS